MGILVDRFLLPRVSDSANASPRGEERAGAEPGDAKRESVTSAQADAEEVSAAAENASADQPTLDAILALTDRGRRTRALQAYINRLSPTEFAGALQSLGRITSTNERELASRLLVAAWVEADPDGALQFAASNRGYEYLAEDVFLHRAANDFDGALTQAQALPGNELRYRALRGLLQFRADTDPAGAVQLALTLGEFPGNESLTGAVYRQWAKVDPEEAARQAALNNTGQGWRSPVQQVVGTWADQDPVAAAKWSLTLPDAETRARSVSEVMRDWSREDPGAAANWIHSLPQGAERDAAVAGYAYSVAGTEPQVALEWVATMSDESARQRTLQRVGRIVMWRDPQNGPALLQAAGVPADQIVTPRRRRGDGDR